MLQKGQAQSLTLTVTYFWPRPSKEIAWTDIFKRLKRSWTLYMVYSSYCKYNWKLFSSRTRTKNPSQEYKNLTNPVLLISHYPSWEHSGASTWKSGELGGLEGGPGVSLLEDGEGRNQSISISLIFLIVFITRFRHPDERVWSVWWDNKEIERSAIIDIIILTASDKDNSTHWGSLSFVNHCEGLQAICRAMVDI